MKQYLILPIRKYETAALLGEPLPMLIPQPSEDRRKDDD